LFEIFYIELYSLRGFQQYKVHPNFLIIFCFGLNDFLMKIMFNLQFFYNICQHIMKPNRCTTIPWEHSKGSKSTTRGITIQKISPWQTKQNKQTTFLHRKISLITNLHNFSSCHDIFSVCVYSWCFDKLWYYLIKFFMDFFSINNHHILTICEIISIVRFL